MGIPGDNATAEAVFFTNMARYGVHMERVRVLKVGRSACCSQGLRGVGVGELWQRLRWQRQAASFHRQVIHYHLPMERHVAGGPGSLAMLHSPLHCTAPHGAGLHTGADRVILQVVVPAVALLQHLHRPASSH